MVNIFSIFKLAFLKKVLISEFQKRSDDYLTDMYHPRNNGLFADGKTFKESSSDKRARYLYSRFASLAESNSYPTDTGVEASKRRFLKSK